jgi:hypothetical protein
MTLVLRKKQDPIRTLDDWFRLAPPAGGADQWVEHKSAMSCAQSWLADAPTGGPPEILHLLHSHPAFSKVVFDVAEPEVRLVFDHRAGNTRNTDMQVLAHDASGAIALAIEAKAGESFGETVADALVDGVETRRTVPRSTKLERVDELARSILRGKHGRLPALGGIRYQLLAATAGVLAWALRIECQRAVLVVHEFVTALTSDAQHARCSADLLAFVRRLSGDPTVECSDGRLLGPFRVPGLPLLEHPPNLYIGKVQRNTRL